MATFRKRTGANPWQARVWTNEGRQASKSFPNKTLAKLWAQKMEVDVRSGSFVDPRAGNTPFAVYAEGWMRQREGRLAQSSWKRDRSYLNSLILPALGDAPVGSLTTTNINDWLANLSVKESTAATALQIVRSVLERARLSKAISHNPVDDVQSKPRPRKTKRPGRALTDLELAAVIDAAESTDKGTSLIVLAMGRLGLRVGEALGLRVEDFDVEAGTVTIERSRDRDGTANPLKGRDAGDRRVIPLPHDVASRFTEHVDAMEPQPIKGDLFVTRAKTPLLYSNWRTRHWLPTVAAAGVGHLVPHDLRHTVVTRLLLVDRWGPAEVQAFVGHRDARVTLEVYAHLKSDDLKMPSPLARTSPN